MTQSFWAFEGILYAKDSFWFVLYRLQEVLILVQHKCHLRRGSSPSIKACRSTY